METLVLCIDDLRRIIQHVGIDVLMDRTVEGIEKACAAYDPHGCQSPARAGFFYSAPTPGLLEWMPAMDSGGRATIKIVGYHPENPRRTRLPTILSVVASFDTQSGHMLALLDGTFLTAMRTGAASAIASRVLARPDSRTLALIGCGAQAVAQLHALSRSFRLERVLLADVDAEAVRTFPKRAERLGLGGLRFETRKAAELVQEADILCTCTSVRVGAGPVFEDVGLLPWAHVNAIGSDFPGKIETPRSLLERSFLCADFPEQCLREGECQQLEPSRIDASLVELVQNPERYRREQERLTVFDSTGWALEDHVAADILIREARRLGLGARVPIEASSRRDPLSPYDFLDLAVEADDELLALVRKGA